MFNWLPCAPPVRDGTAHGRIDEGPACRSFSCPFQCVFQDRLRSISRLCLLTDLRPVSAGSDAAKPIKGAKAAKPAKPTCAVGTAGCTACRNRKCVACTAGVDGETGQYPDNKGVCKPCKDAGCAKCRAVSGGCTQCKPGMGLVKNKCSACGTGFVVNPKTQKCMKVGKLCFGWLEGWLGADWAGIGWHSGCCTVAVAPAQQHALLSSACAAVPQELHRVHQQCQVYHLPGGLHPH